MSRPIIGITKPERGDNLAYLAMCFAIWIAGGRPMRLSTGQSWREAKIDGLLIGGGADVFPEHYGQGAIDGAHYDRDRDEMEMYWARKSRDGQIPTLAICRGSQVMNVANGGSLHQNLSEVYDNVDYPSSLFGQIFYRKRINIEAGSQIATMLGRSSAWVNSIHKQAMAQVGDGLTVTARETNGVVQAIENKERDFYIGLQFHPEFLIYRAQFRRIFIRFVRAARAYSAEVRT